MPLVCPPDSQVRPALKNQRLTFIIPRARMRYQDPTGPPSRWRRRHRRPARLPQPDGQPLYAAAGETPTSRAVSPSTAPPITLRPAVAGAITSTAVLTVGRAHHSPILSAADVIRSVPRQHCAQN